MPSLEISRYNESINTVMTDPYSLYRQVFSKDLNFFMYVLDNSPPPFEIKLHITSLVPFEFSELDIKQNVLNFIQKPEYGFWNSKEISLEVR